jgi:High potential iron-sulfur protein
MNAVNPRRRFMLQVLAAAISLPLIGQSFAQALKKLTEQNPTAKALKYVEDASASKEPSIKPGSNCSNCQFFTAGNSACSLHPGYSVAAKGWCTAWAKNA